MGLFDDIKRKLTRMYIYGIPIRTHTERRLYDIKEQVEDKNSVVIKWKPMCIKSESTLNIGYREQYFTYYLN